MFTVELEFILSFRTLRLKEDCQVWIFVFLFVSLSVNHPHFLSFLYKALTFYIYSENHLKRFCWELNLPSLIQSLCASHTKYFKDLIFTFFVPKTCLVYLEIPGYLGGGSVDWEKTCFHHDWILFHCLKRSFMASAILVLSCLQWKTVWSFGHSAVWPLTVPFIYFYLQLPCCSSLNQNLKQEGLFF